MNVCGAFPLEATLNAKFSSKHFTNGGDFIHKVDSGGEKIVPMSHWATPPKPMRPLLESLIKDVPAGKDADRHKAKLEGLIELVEKCIIFDPAKRLTPEQALEHAVMKKGGNAGL